MNAKELFQVIGNIEEDFIREASPKTKCQPVKKRISRWVAAAALAVTVIIAIPVTAFAIEMSQYNAAVTYLASLGIEAEDLSDYSRREVIDAVKTYDAGESSAIIDALLRSEDNKMTVTDQIAQVTSQQVRSLEPTMTCSDVIAALGNTIDIGSGIYILQYEVDGEYLINIPFASDTAQLGVTGDKLLEAKQPIEDNK